MQDTIIAIFCYVDDFLKALSWKDDSQCRLCRAEIVTIALTAARFYSGNLESARIFLAEHGYIPFICKSRLNRRLSGGFVIDLESLIPLREYCRTHKWPRLPQRHHWIYSKAPIANACIKKIGGRYLVDLHAFQEYVQEATHAVASSKRRRKSRAKT